MIEIITTMFRSTPLLLYRTSGGLGVFLDDLVSLASAEDSRLSTDHIMDDIEFYDIQSSTLNKRQLNKLKVSGIEPKSNVGVRDLVLYQGVQELLELKRYKNLKSVQKLCSIMKEYLNVQYNNEEDDQQASGRG